MKVNITAKFHASRRLRFEDTKGIMSPEKFRDFRETGPWSGCDAHTDPILQELDFFK